MTDSLFTLYCRDHDATAQKTLVFDDEANYDSAASKAYNAGYRFDALRHKVSSLKSLGALLRKAATLPRVFIIRGELRNGADRASNITRSYRHPERDNAWEPASPGRRWLCVDIDDMDMPVWLFDNLKNPEDEELQWAANYAHEYLPKPFREANCVYQWSSSAFSKNLSALKIHLWFWLDRPASTASLRDYWKNFPVADAKLYNPVQPHFVATPAFKGIEDPLAGKRFGTSIGSQNTDTVTLPSNVVSQRAYKATQKDYTSPDLSDVPVFDGDQDVPYRYKRYAEATLSHVLDDVSNAVPGERNNTQLRAAARLGQFTVVGLLNREYVEKALLKAALQASTDKDAAKIEQTVQNGLVRGETNPFDVTTLD